MEAIVQEYIQNLAKPTVELPHYEAQAYTQSRLDEQWEYWCKTGRENARQPLLASLIAERLQRYVNCGLNQQQLENWLLKPCYQYTLVWDLPFDYFLQNATQPTEDDAIAYQIYLRENNIF